MEVKTNFMQKVLDYIYVMIFGKYTLNGFILRQTESKKYNYIFDSVFPDDKTMNIALSIVSEKLSNTLNN